MALPHLDRYALAAGGIIVGGFLLALSPCGVRPLQSRFEAVRRARTIAVGLRDYSFETKRFPVDGLEVLSREGYVPEQVLVDP